MRSLLLRMWSAGLSIVLFEPGEEKEVQLTEMGGRQRVFGLNDLTRAQATDDTKAASMETAKLKGFL